MLPIPDLFAYTEWANAAMLGAAAARPAADWTRDLGGSFPTLQAVLAHSAGGEWVWLSRWTGDAPTAPPPWIAAPAPADLRAALDAVEQTRRAWLAGLSPADLDAPLPYTLFNGTTSAEPLGVQMQHVVNHATYHRGQAAAMLRRLGATPPQTDLIAWARLQST
jgi:uncharacterized damage-inducible protein DinB